MTAGLTSLLAGPGASSSCRCGGVSWAAPPGWAVAGMRCAPFDYTVTQDEEPTRNGHPTGALGPHRSRQMINVEYMLKNDITTRHYNTF